MMWDQGRNGRSSAADHPLDQQPCDFQPTIDQLRLVLNSALRGKSQVTELVLACLLARGHLLIEDLPGLGKTTLAKALAQAVGGSLGRVQCTPDLLPTDITGFQMFNQKTREFEFVPGPVFCDVLLADEINRATPRTQSALFEAMSERQVTLDHHTRPLPPSFFVIATQNPIESHGAFPLPEAQLDRFAMRISIGYPDRKSEYELLAASAGELVQPAKVAAVLSPPALERLQDHVARVFVAPAVREYLLDLAAATRSHAEIPCGLSPRGLLIWQRVAQARAHLRGHDFVTPDDVYETAFAVLDVRLPGDLVDRRGLIAAVLERATAPVSEMGRRRPTS